MPLQEKNKKTEIGTSCDMTWCPGCYNFMILASLKNVLSKLIKEGYRQENFSMCTGIGCHPKIFDYLNISGVYGLHGRVLPVCLGMKLGNPNLTVLGFSGDGDAYAEGMEHFIHAARFNANMTYIVADNQNFALTTGQSTPTSQQGYVNKAQPLGEFNRPLNPIKIALASGASFVARCDAKNINHTAEILEKAIRHKGFAYIEIMQHCLIFNPETKDEDRLMYQIENGNDMRKAMELANEFDYNTKAGKIPIGIIFKEERKTLEEEWPQLKRLRESGKSWKDLK